MEEKTLFGKIAAVAHEASRVFTNVFCDYNAFSPKWEECTEEVRQSIINGVEFVLENMQTSFRDTHENWVKFKVAHGWKHGKQFNLEKKEHPNLVGYGDLSTEEKAKDYLFKNIVLGLAEAYGLIGGTVASKVAVAAPIDPEVLKMAQLVIDDKAIIVNMEGVQSTLEASQRIVEQLSPVIGTPKDSANQEEKKVEEVQDNIAAGRNMDGSLPVGYSGDIPPMEEVKPEIVASGSALEDAMQKSKESEEGNQGIDDGAIHGGTAKLVPSEEPQRALPLENKDEEQLDSPSQSPTGDNIPEEVTEGVAEPDQSIGRGLSEPSDVNSPPIDAEPSDDPNSSPTDDRVDDIDSDRVDEDVPTDDVNALSQPRTDEPTDKPARKLKAKKAK